MKYKESVAPIEKGWGKSLIDWIVFFTVCQPFVSYVKEEYILHCENNSFAFFFFIRQYYIDIFLR